MAPGQAFYAMTMTAIFPHVVVVVVVLDALLGQVFWRVCSDLGNFRSVVHEQVLIVVAVVLLCIELKRRSAPRVIIISMALILEEHATWSCLRRSLLDFIDHILRVRLSWRQNVAVGVKLSDWRHVGPRRVVD